MEFSSQRRLIFHQAFRNAPKSAHKSIPKKYLSLFIYYFENLLLYICTVKSFAIKKVFKLHKRRRFISKHLLDLNHFTCWSSSLTGSRWRQDSCWLFPLGRLEAVTAARRTSSLSAEQGGMLSTWLSSSRLTWCLLFSLSVCYTDPCVLCIILLFVCPVNM